MSKALETVLEKIERGEPLTATEQTLLADSEARWDAFKEAEHADEAALERQPAGVPSHVLRGVGLVEVLKRTPDGVRYRAAGGSSVGTAPESDFRPVMTSAVAAAMLKRLPATAAQPLPTDAERRARLRAQFDLFDVAQLERDVSYFTALAAAGATLWTMEKVPYRLVRQHLVAELSLATGTAVSLPEVG